MLWAEPAGSRRSHAHLQLPQPVQGPQQQRAAQWVLRQHQTSAPQQQLGSLLRLVAQQPHLAVWHHLQQAPEPLLVAWVPVCAAERAPTAQAVKHVKGMRLTLWPEQDR